MIFRGDHSIAEPSRHVEFIDGLRGIAILMVVVLHSSVHSRNSYALSEASNFFWTFGSAVPLFFVLSAYTLFLSSNARNESGRFSTLAFYARRMFRILPLWWLVCLYYSFFFGWSYRDAFLSMTFAAGFFENAHKICVTPVGWSLFVEEAFYLFFPVWLRFITSTWRACLALSIFYFGSRYYLSRFPLAAGMQPNFVRLTFENYFAFFVGILVWFLSREKLIEQITRSPIVRILMDFCTVAGFIGVFLVGWNERSFIWGGVLLVATTPGTLTRRLFSTRYLTATGGLCYGIYLLHHVIEQHFTERLQTWLYGRLPGEIEVVIAFFVTIALTTTLAWFVFKYFEKPIVRRGRKWLDRIR